MSDRSTSAPEGEAAPGLVEVTRSGGFAGLTLRGEVDLDRLSGADRDAWDVALGEALPGLAGHEPAPDRFVYRVVQPAVGFAVTVGESELPDDVRALLDRAVLPPPP